MGYRTRDSARRSTGDRGIHPVLVVVATLAAVNVLSNQVAGGWYVPLAVATAVAITAYAVGVDGCSARDLGWDPAALRSGITWGLVLVAGVALVYAVGAALPLTRPLFEDTRVAGLDGADVVYRAAIRVPLGTVALEETAFRSVLLAMFLARTSTVRAVAWSSLLFGLWHVLPALGMGNANPVLEQHLAGPAGTVVTVAGGVAGTALAGGFFCWLRLRTGSILSPMLLHWATNGLGYVVAWLVLRAG